jgi:hypothetical protein
MNAVVKAAPVGMKGVDTIRTMTSAILTSWKAAGVQFVGRYLGSLVSSEVALILSFGMAVTPIIYAHKEGWHPTIQLAQTDGAGAVTNAKAAEILPGATIWIDIEGISVQATTVDIIDYVNTVANILTKAGFIAGLYVGAGFPLNGTQLYKLLVVTRYWKSQSKLLIDSTNQLVAEPDCGWVMYQMYPEQVLDGEQVDYNMTQNDYQNRSVMMMQAA